jgi:hypothetical protein
MVHEHDKAPSVDRVTVRAGFTLSSSDRYSLWIVAHMFYSVKPFRQFSVVQHLHAMNRFWLVEAKNSLPEAWGAAEYHTV